MADNPPQSSYNPDVRPDAGFTAPDSSAAADVIRQKLARIYASEPDAEQERMEADASERPSRHQQFMHALSSSGKDLATIQTEWHNYYLGLSDVEKHEVWQEFYSNSTTPAIQPASPVHPIPPQNLAEHKHEVVTSARHKARRAERTKRPRRDLRSPEAIRSVIRDTVTANGQLTAKHHLQSLVFGLGVGAIVVLIFLFSFFNEVIITPFIQPSRTVAATPIIDASNAAPTGGPQVIIPKINVQIPVDYSQTTTVEADIENALENGIVHYPSTVMPGEQGNAAFFGHSSNNIFNKGKYKFAFVLLHTLAEGDTFYLSYNGKMYVYKVISRSVVEPSQIEVLGPVPGQAATATLITCDPPGTSLKRLVVVGQQISPDPAGNVASSKPATALGDSAATLPGNGPTLGSRLLHTAAGKLLVVSVIVAIFIFTMRWVNKPRRDIQ